MQFILLVVVLVCCDLMSLLRALKLQNVELQIVGNNSEISLFSKFGKCVHVTVTESGVTRLDRRLVGVASNQVRNSRSCIFEESACCSPPPPDLATRGSTHSMGHSGLSSALGAPPDGVPAKSNKSGKAPASKTKANGTAKAAEALREASKEIELKAGSGGSLGKEGNSSASTEINEDSRRARDMDYDWVNEEDMEVFRKALIDEPHEQLGNESPHLERIRSVSDFAPIQERVRRYVSFSASCAYVPIIRSCIRAGFGYLRSYSDEIRRWQ